jgi:predicted secreted protein
MSPELERLLAALYERDTCEPQERDRWERIVSRLLEDAMHRVPNASRQQFLEAISDRYRQFVRARRKPPTIPPKA